MKKSVLLGGLLVVLCGVVWANLVANRQKLPDFVPDAMNKEIAGTVDSMISAIAEKDARSLSKVWQRPADREKVRELIRKIGSGGGKFELQCAFYEKSGQGRIIADGIMPNGNFAEMKLDRCNGKLVIVSIDMQ